MTSRKTIHKKFNRLMCTFSDKNNSALDGKKQLTKAQWNALCELLTGYEEILNIFWSALDDAQARTTDKKFFTRLEKIKSIKGGIMLWEKVR